MAGVEAGEVTSVVGSVRREGEPDGGVGGGGGNR